MIQLDNTALASKFFALQPRLEAMGDLSRFQYAVLASLALHAFVLFGITIRPLELSNLDRMPPSLEVVLVNAKSTSRPVKAEALAQHNLDGGGNTDADRRARTPLPVTRDDPQTNELKMESQRVEQLEQEAKKLLTQIQSQATVESASPQPEPQTETKIAPNAADLMRMTQEIARLEAQIDKNIDNYNKRPRKMFIGARTQEYRFSRYIEDWRLKVERIGTLNFPQAARDQKIFGSLLMTVSIKADGTLDSVEINRSSGQKILDEAARRIVDLAGRHPNRFAPFPPDIAKDVDILSITRTWTFTRTDELITE